MFTRRIGLSVFCACWTIYFMIAATAQDAGDPAVSRPESGEPLVKDGVLDLDAAVKHFETLYQSEGTAAEIEFKVTRPRTERTMRLKAWSKGKDQVLIVVEAPPRDKGMATLKVDDNLWNYMPKIKRTIRIPPSMMLSSWMGSDFTNDDLVSETSVVDDYSYELLGASEEPPGWLIEFTARPGVVGLWNSFVLTVSHDGKLPLEAKYYNRRDELARTMRWSDPQVFDGRLTPSRLVLVPEDQEGHKTEMVYLDVDFDADVPSSMFSLSSLEQHR
jgi:outer membrane lipoprotein-sorting protein